MIGGKADLSIKLCVMIRVTPPRESRRDSLNINNDVTKETAGRTVVTQESRSGPELGWELSGENVL